MPLPSPAAHAEVLATFAAVAHAVAHPARLRLLSLLTQAPRTVTTLAKACGESIANASAHLAVLTEAGVLRRQREGRHIRYALASDEVSNLVAALRAVGEAVAPRAVQPHFAAFHGPDVAPLSPADLRGQLQRGVALVDVRPADEYAAGHLPGARSLPLPQLRDARPSPHGTPSLIYCRGRYCLGAVEGVRLLSRRGTAAVRRLPFGVAEWTAAGYALEVGR
jgi:rhodanese-related sulfurtransferase/DNA-binding transcriptional ArsR family regulator